MVFTILFLPFLTWADVPAKGSAKALLCELVDLRKSRTLERRQVAINPQSPRPILMLMGGSDATGTVRDFPSSDSMSRKLEITLEGSQGFGGHSHSGASYRLDQAGNNQLLGEAELDGEFGPELLLRCFLKNTSAIDLMFLTPSTTTETGRGHYSGFCEGNSMASFCLDQIRRHALDDANRDADFSCRVHGGMSQSFSGYCNDFCSPPFIRSGVPRQYVTCDATCQIRCEMSH